ncbi:hypothetical protein NUW54_g53 [Trametes sanguinea]|uniref:Uncharacterized protein n=1 Tax=Trametes sanguinea TaxID=158606 RepID=A0ACC1QA92_9APHY|nr:hypothetical protein NUW54_g53 [Trametes sanguinea]
MCLSPAARALASAACDREERRLVRAGGGRCADELGSERAYGETHVVRLVGTETDISTLGARPSRSDREQQARSTLAAPPAQQPAAMEARIQKTRAASPDLSFNCMCPGSK